MKVKLTKVERGLYRHPDETLWIRKSRRGYKELLCSTGHTNIVKARRAAEEIVSAWLKAGNTPDFIPFEVPALELKKLIEVSKSRNTYLDYECHMRMYLVPFFRGMGLDEVGRHWQRYIAEQMVAKPSRKLMHDRKHLIRVLKFSRERGYSTIVPDLKLDKSHTVAATGREFSNAELSAIFSKAREKRRHTRTALKLELQLKTGMRQNERRLLKWEYINLETKLITLPKEICKNRSGRTYAVDSELLGRMIEERVKGSEWVFPGRRDDSIPESRSQTGWRKICAEIGLKGKQHWLRHTFVTRAIRKGVSPQLVQKAVGMSSKVMNDVYLHAHEKDARMLSEMMAESLKDLA